jgi:hypothetical protein
MENSSLALVLQGISALCFFLGVFTVNGFKRVLDNLQKSVGDLNLNIVKLIEKDINKDRRLDSHSSSIEKQDIEIKLLRENYNSTVNAMVSQIRLNELKIEDMEKKL